MKKFATEQHHEQTLESLGESIRIPPVLDEVDSGQGHPFGKKVIEALDKVLEINEKLGSRIFKDPEDYYGYSGTGSGDESFGILCHMDVVPAGNENNWEAKPFDPAIKDGWLVGRGSQDDRGPSIVTMYAARALTDTGVESKTRIRFISGTDEKNLWRCLEKYNEKEEGITQGFVPDAEFPLIYTGKGLLQICLTGPGTNELSVEVGGTLDVVPDAAPCSGEKLSEVKETLKKHEFDFEEQGEGIVALGKSIHARDAAQGVNAISRLAIALSEVFDFGPINFLGKLVQESAIGEAVVGKTEDEQSGELTMNFASLEITPEQTKISVDMRIPVTFKKDDLVAKLTKTAEEYGLTYEEFDFPDSLHVPLDSELVKNLLGTYRDITGDMTEPFASSGTTFARTMNQCVVFGAMFPDTPDLMYQTNERWELSSMYKAMEIYAGAVYRLCAK